MRPASSEVMDYCIVVCTVCMTFCIRLLWFISWQNISHNSSLVCF